MTPREKIETLKKLLNGAVDAEDEKTLEVYLSLAGEAIVRKRFPFDPDREAVPKEYSYLQCKVAAYLWNKQGAEGETAHNENGISRTYESADIPPSMLKDVVPLAGVL